MGISIRYLKIGNWKNFAKKTTFEKREYLRAKVSKLIKYSTENIPSEEKLSNLLNLSEKGLQFFSKDSLSLGSVLHIVINMPEFHKEIPVVTKVAWVRSTKEYGGGYFIGGQFIDLDEKDCLLIHNFVEHEKQRYEM